jgi:predicted GNAT family acetyltransferase
MTCYQNTLAATRFASNRYAQGLRVEPLSAHEKGEALSFLSARPIHTVCMSSFLQDNGVISPKNRGTFFGCRDASGSLQGVALIGHATLLETENDAALQAFAYLKHKFVNAHLVRGERETVSRFWKHYAEFGHQPRLARREVLLVQNSAHSNSETVSQLRPATIDELEELKLVNAQFIRDECGIDPLERDPVGFSSRLARRIAKNRVWILQRDGEVIFKADIFAQTSQAAYLEGVFVNPDYRGQGIGLRCLQDLSSRLLQESDSLCLLINEQTKGLEHFYTRAGYSMASLYDTIYLNSGN